MAKLRRGTQTALSEAESLRLRAAWLYYDHGLTQKDVAAQLGVSRTTIIRLLDEAKKRGEVRIWIGEGEDRCMQLAVRLERAFALDEAVVVPETAGAEQAARSVGLALGQFLSEAIADNMTIGVGWGRTLNAALPSFRPPRHSGVRVLSMLGGAIDTRIVNPAEFTWRLAAQLDAECFLFPAPLIVDSAQTRRALMERCGLDRLASLAGRLDIAIVSVGDAGPNASSLAARLIARQERDELAALGAVGDLMCHFLDAEGRDIAHPLSERVMSIGLDAVRRAGHVVIACGGAARAAAIRAAMIRVGCNTLLTDEGAARALLALAGAANEN